MEEYAREVVDGVGYSRGPLAAPTSGHNPDCVLRVVDRNVRRTRGPLAPTFGHSSDFPSLSLRQPSNSVPAFATPITLPCSSLPSTLDNRRDSPAPPSKLVVREGE